MAPRKRSLEVGGLKEVDPNTPKIQQLAAYAVEEYNKKEGKCLKYQKATKAKEQVVAGMMYYITLEATDDDEKTNTYEAKVWEKSWIHWKQLEAFQCVSNAPIPTCN